MALDGYTDQTMSRQAMKAELLDAETELRLAYAWRDQRDEQALHRLIYLIAILGVIHFWWLVKKDIREPALFAVILAVLLGVRVVFAWRKRVVTASARAHQT